MSKTAHRRTLFQVLLRRLRRKKRPQRRRDIQTAASAWVPDRGYVRNYTNFPRPQQLQRRLIELPTFAHSDNHAGLQIADAFCSALVTPIAVHSYCTGHINSIHVRPGYVDFKSNYAARIRPLQHRYQIQNGRWLGGLVVSDDLGHKGGGHLFR